MKNSIILLTYNNLPMIHARLVELSGFPEGDFEIIVVNNGSNNKDVEKNLTWWKAHCRHKVQVIELRENQGFAGGFNYGVSLARGENVILLSDDVKIRKCFLPEVDELLEIKENFLLGGRIVDWAAGWNEFEVSGNKVIIPYCEGYMLSLKKRFWNELGGFDERFLPFDYEDIDLSFNVIYNGGWLQAMSPKYFQHLGGMTIKDSNRLNITKQHREIFYEKWKFVMVETMENVKWKLLESSQA